MDNSDLHNLNIKFCPNCGAEVKKPTIRCIKCGEPFIDFNNDVSDNFIQKEHKISDKTKHVDEAGVSFDFPEYYLLASIPNNVPDCIIALVKDDGTCDVMVEAANSIDGINYDANFEDKYKKYISSFGYYDIKIISGFGPKQFCFQSYTKHNVGIIKQTTYFDFRFKKNIRITFNTLKKINYDCMDDLKMIERSITYVDKITIFKNKMLYTNEDNELRISTTKSVSLATFFIFGFITVVSFWEAISYNDLIGQILGVIAAFVIGGLFFSIFVLIIGTLLKKSNKTLGNKKTLKDTIFYCEDDDGNLRLSKTKIICWIVFLIGTIYSIFININDPTIDNTLISLIVASIVLGIIFAIPFYIIGYTFHYFLKRKNK